MSKKSFSASHWFTQKKISIEDSPDIIIRDRSQDSKPPKSSGIFAPFIDQRETEVVLENELNRFFVPGWKGESLISKNIKIFVKTIDAFHKDVQSHFLKNDKFSRRLKISIFDEFLNFAEYKALNCPKLDHYTHFWSELIKIDSEYRSEIDAFIKIFSFRIAVIYLFKVRFITTLSEKTNIEFDLKNIYNPNSFFTSIFKSSSSSALQARSFEQNVFSWYRPSEALKKCLIQFKEICTDLKITEMIKTISVKSEELLDNKTVYSHSISHKQFGLYLNSLLLNVPTWIGTLNNKFPASYSIPNDDLDIISCKYAGDYLESMGLSHWLAQDHNKKLKWEQIICPDFKNHDFENGAYLKNINELQFLTFLADIANTQGQEPISFICKVINSHLHNRKNSEHGQKSLIINDTALNHSTYDRIILNLNLFPKNNPQHFLFSKILSQKEFLKDEGYIFVITSKKLFVPSQKAKVEQLLKELKIEAVFNLDEIEGKGEVGDYIYVFSNQNSEFTTKERDKKHSCLNFRYSANLKSFNEFERLTILTSNFFQKHIGDLPPLYQQIDSSFRLEFYQDAIVGGQLIQSTSKDTSNITHPGFFKRLMSLCNSLDYFFDIQSIDFAHDRVSDNESFFDMSKGFQREISPFIFIIDQRQKNNVQIEIVNSSLLEVKSYEYGHALCTYFYAYQKWPSIHIHAIKDFLNSSIGKQIINLTFNNELRKVKGNLNKLLLPNFFIDNTEIPSHIKEGFALLEYNSEELLNLHPSSLEKAFTNIECFLPNITKDYPAQTLNMFSQFKKAVEKSMDILGNSKQSSKINFKNPILQSPLLLSKTIAIYPENQEIFVDFNSEAHHLIHEKLESTKLVQHKVHNEISFGLELYSNGQKVLTFYSDEEMILFLDFLTTETVGANISQILQGVAVPQLKDLKAIIASYNSLARSLRNIYEKLLPLQDRLLSSTILHGK